MVSKHIWAKTVTASLAAISLVAVAGCTPTDNNNGQETSSISVSHWGGIWEDGINAVQPGFTAESGISIVGTADGQNGLTKIQQLPSAYDAALLTADKATVGLKNGDLQEIDPSRIENFDKIPEILVDSLTVDGKLAGVPISYGAQAILYRKDLLGFEITSWKDLWRPELKGQIAVGAMPSVSAVWVLYAGADAFGTSPNDIEAGWKALETFKENIQYQFTVTSDPLSKLADGSLLATIVFADQGIDLQELGVEIVIPESGTPWSVQPLAIPAGAKNVDAVYDFINYLLSDEAQTAWVRATKVAPANGAVTLPEELAKTLLETPEVANRLWPIDWLEIGENIEDWTIQWQEALS